MADATVGKKTSAHQSGSQGTSLMGPGADCGISVKDTSPMGPAEIPVSSIRSHRLTMATEKPIVRQDTSLMGPATKPRLLISTPFRKENQIPTNVPVTQDICKTTISVPVSKETSLMGPSTSSIDNNNIITNEEPRNDGTFRLGLLNINSISEIRSKKSGKKRISKFEYLQKFLDRSSTSVCAITEFRKESDKTLAEYYRNHNTHVIMSNDLCYRVGLVIPKFLEDVVTIIDSFTVEQQRKQKCQISCHYALYRIKLTTAIHIAVVYLTPDANVDVRIRLFDRINDDSQRYLFYSAVGDFNIDQQIESKRMDTERMVQGYMFQKIGDVTRMASRSSGQGLEQLSKTTIDLVFLNHLLNTRFEKYKILKDSPTDHYMVETHFNFKIPQAFTIEKFYLDPTRRPPIKSFALKKVLKITKENMEKHVDPMLENLTQSESFELFEKTLVPILDQFCPLNPSEQQTRKVYRFYASPETRRVIKKMKGVYKARILIKNKLNEDPDDFFLNLDFKNIDVIYKKLRKERKRLVKSDKRAIACRRLDDSLSRSKNVWNYIKQTRTSDRIDQNKVELNIRGKTGQDMVHHMTDYIHGRAHLVAKEDIIEHRNWIPMPNIDRNTITVSEYQKSYKAEELYKPKKFPSLACGPDTISHRHVWDLAPAIMDTLQKIIEKPIDDFHNIRLSYSRLISKEKCSKGQKLVEKSQRPIGEVNVLAKYGPIRMFMDQLQDTLSTQIGQNQYAFPGKGATMGIFEMLDTVISRAASGAPTIVALWDFSNAFCTYDHSVLMHIAKEGYKIPNNQVKLLDKYNQQSHTIMKMNDSNGFYLGDEDSTGVGGIQGQIGTNLTFAMTNDGMEPIEEITNEDIMAAYRRLKNFSKRKLIDSLDDVVREIKRVKGFAKRFKYVDDFTDILTADTVEEILLLLDHNADMLLKGATATGAKLNAGKTQIMAINCDKKLSIFCKRYTLVNDARTLGVTFEKNPLKKFPHISCNPTAKALISRLNSACHEVSTSRKIKPYLPDRVIIATDLIRSKIYDIATAYVYADQSIFSEICVCIRKVIKAAGLRPDIDREDLYKLSFDMSPEDIAIKQIITTGIKMVNMDVLYEKRYRCPESRSDLNKPFIKCFTKKWNQLPLDLRKFIVQTTLEKNIKNPKDAISNRLNQHFSLGFTKFDKDKKKDFIFKHKYVKDWFKSKKVSLKQSKKRASSDCRSPKPKRRKGSDLNLNLKRKDLNLKRKATECCGRDKHLRKRYNPGIDQL